MTVLESHTWSGSSAFGASLSLPCTTLHGTKQTRHYFSIKQNCLLLLTSLDLLAIKSILAPKLCAILAFSKEVQFPLITTTALSFIKPEGTSAELQRTVEVRFSRGMKVCRERGRKGM